MSVNCALNTRNHLGQAYILYFVQLSGWLYFTSQLLFKLPFLFCTADSLQILLLKKIFSRFNGTVVLKCIYLNLDFKIKNLFYFKIDLYHIFFCFIILNKGHIVFFFISCFTSKVKILLLIV